MCRLLVGSVNEDLLGSTHPVLTALATEQLHQPEPWSLVDVQPIHQNGSWISPIQAREPLGYDLVPALDGKLEWSANEARIACLAGQGRDGSRRGSSCRPSLSLRVLLYESEDLRLWEPLIGVRS